MEVARATGEYNILKVRITEDGNAYLAKAGDDFEVPIKGNGLLSGKMVENGLLGFRPDEILIHPSGSKDFETPKAFVECGTAEVLISS